MRERQQRCPSRSDQSDVAVEITQQKLEQALRAVDVMSRAKPSERLSAQQIEITKAKAAKLVVIYRERLARIASG